MAARIYITAAGATCLIALAYFGGAAGLGPVKGAGPRIEAEIAQLAQGALAARGLDWAQISVSGQQVEIAGEAPLEAERREALSAVAAAGGAGGVWRGPVIAVKDAVTVSPPLAPYRFAVSREGDRATLDGAAPSRQVREELVQYARRLFPGGVVDTVDIAAGAPNAADWEAAARIVLTQLAAMGEGEIVLRDETLTATGWARARSQAERIAEELSRAPSRFDVVVDIDHLNAAGADRRAAAPETQSQPERTALSLSACQAALTAELETGALTFIPGGPGLEKEGYPLADRLSEIALSCGRAVIVVVGHPGPDPEPADSALWLERAQALADYFALKGMALDQSKAIAGRPDGLREASLELRVEQAGAGPL